MTVSPSIVKGHSLLGEDTTTTHVCVIADEGGEEAILDVVGAWVSAGVLEPAIWIPSSWLSSRDDGHLEPAGIVFGRRGQPERRQVSVLEVLAREPHTHLIVTIINPLAGREDELLSQRINGLLRSLATSRPHERTIDQRSITGTQIRAINAIFPSGGQVVEGLAARLIRSDSAEVENFVVNPEDRPTPTSFDVVPHSDSTRWPSYLVSSTASICGLWSSLAISPVENDANWVLGNVRLVRSFARVVLTHPLLVQVSEATRDTLVSDRCPIDAPGVILSNPQLAPFDPAILAKHQDNYAQWVMDDAGLGYREIGPFEPPSRMRRGLAEALGEFGSFAADRMAALPRWIWQRIISRFNKGATKQIYGDDSLDVDVRVDLNRRTDDPRLVEAWDLVAQERSRLEEILESPIDAPEESSDPYPWIAMHEGVAFFAEAAGNSVHDALRNEVDGPLLVASNLVDVIPPPDDRFTVDPVCDELLGGDGTGRQVSWMDVDGASRLRSLMQRVASMKRQRVHDLREAYLKTEHDFFETQERFLRARFNHEDRSAQFARETRIADADNVSPGGVSTRDMHTASPSGLSSSVDTDKAEDAPETVDPFATPLDEAIATPSDLMGLRQGADEAEIQSAREKRLRRAMSDVTVDEAERIRIAEEELKIIDRTHGQLSRWIERRSASFVGRILFKIADTNHQLDDREQRVLESAREAIPNYGSTSIELQRRFVTSVLVGTGIAALIALLAALANELIPGFDGVQWWAIGVLFLTILIIIILTALITYFQSWTRERLRADDARAHLQYQCALVAHVRTERLRLAQLYSQVPQRVRALSQWWHYWESGNSAAPTPRASHLPSCDELPFHLRWAVATWSQSQVFRRLQDDLLAGRVRSGYRSTLIEQAIGQYESIGGYGDMLKPENLARIRSSDALNLVEEWVANDQTRQSTNAELERQLAQAAQGLNRDPNQVAPHVEVLNPDPLDDLDIETDLVGDPDRHLMTNDDFLLEIASEAAEMGYRLWAPGVGVQPFGSFFAGPERLRKKLPASVRFVDAETTKVCSSEVSVRLDITGQVSVDKLAGAYAPTSVDEDEDDDVEKDDRPGIAAGHQVLVDPLTSG